MPTTIRGNAPVRLPATADDVTLRLRGRSLRLTNLEKVFWPEVGITKRDLLQYYADVAPALLPHLADRAMVMKRYPNGIARQVLLHEARAVAAARVARDLRDRARVGQRHRFPDGAGPGLAALGGQPRMHRPEPVVRPLRRHRPPGLPALRPRSRSRGVPFAACARDGAGRARRARVARHDSRWPRRRGSSGIHVYVPIVRGPDAEGGLALPRRSRRTLERAASRPDHRRVPHREAAARARAGGLQPERLGPHAGVGLLGAAEAAGDGLRRR